jgi:uroporphyrinogen decarboxylase
MEFSDQEFVEVKGAGKPMAPRETMTSRERVLRALNHEEADRVPLDFGAFRSSGIHAGTYRRLRQHLGLEPGRPRLYDLMQQLAEPDDAILDRFHADVVQVHRLAPSLKIPIDRWREGALPDGTPVMVPESFKPFRLADGSWEVRSNGTPIARMTSGGYYYDSVFFPLAGAETEADLDRGFSWPLMTRQELDFIKAQATRRRSSPRAVLLTFGGNIFEGGQGLLGYQNYMYTIAANPSLIAALGERLAAWHVANLELLLPEVDGLIDIIACGDDLGLQRGLQIAAEDYRRLIKPYHAKVYRYIREHTRAHLFLHSCGAIADLLPDLIEIGVQIINPVQISAKGMEPERLKRDFGRDLVFWGGGCDTQKILPYGSPEEVRAEASRNLRAFMPGGGFVFTQVHNILDKVPPENVRVLYDTAYAEGRYGNAVTG